jgi:hypothetical protein
MDLVDIEEWEPDYPNWELQLKEQIQDRPPRMESPEVQVAARLPCRRLAKSARMVVRGKGDQLPQPEVQLKSRGRSWQYWAPWPGST